MAGGCLEGRGERANARALGLAEAALDLALRQGDRFRIAGEVNKAMLAHVHSDMPPASGRERATQVVVGCADERRGLSEAAFWRASARSRLGDLHQASIDLAANRSTDEELGRGEHPSHGLVPPICSGHGGPHGLRDRRSVRGAVPHGRHSRSDFRPMLTCPACGRANPAEASFCMGCAAPLGAVASAREVRKTVTALFCDLVGSTTLGENHDPEVLRPLLHAYFEAMREAVERHGGRVEKYIGDAVSAVFGLPVAHEDDALRAVRAATEMQARLAALNERAAIALAARIGVTTGEVLVPAGGEPLIGDAMNTAARLQANAAPGAVLIGEPTWRLVRDAVAAEPVEPLELRGKAEPTLAFRVTRVASLSPMRARRLDAPMVGRARESALLAGAFERAASDRACQLFTVLGAAGAGKSRLVEEFLTSPSVAGDGDGTAAEVLRGRCLPYGDGITWYPVTEALRGALDLPEFADTDAIRAAIHAAVGAEEHAASLEANLAPLFAAATGGTAEETAWAIRCFLESRGREHPLVLVLDDIHWGEGTFLDLVEHIAEWSRDAGILLLCMARPDLLDVRPAWGGGKTNATTISLAPLTGAETDALIAGLLGSSALPDEVRTRITGVAEGNPLFVEEMLRMLVDDGRLVRETTAEGEHWVAVDDLADVHVPPTISALLSARLDRLSDAERAVVEAAAVAGKTFHRGAVAALLPAPARTEVASHLRSLVRKELVTPGRSALPGEDAYRFRHLLIRDAAYDAIPKTHRSTLHRTFAEWLEGVAGGRVAEQEEIIGYHLELAHRYRAELGLPEDHGLRLRAARALGAAGARALDGGDIRGAIGLLRRAADLAEGDPVALEFVSGLAIAYGWAGDAEQARTAAIRLAAAAAAFGNPVFAARARLETFAHSVFEDPASFDPRGATELVEEALRTFREHGATSFEPAALLWLSNIAWWEGDSERTLLHARLALELGTLLGARSSTMWAVNNMLSSLELGTTPLSRVLADAEAFLERFAGDRWIESSTRADQAYISALLGRPDAARGHAAAGQAIVETLGLGGGMASQALTLGYVAWYERDLVEVVARFREMIEMWEAAGDRMNRGWLGPDLARVLLDLGRDSEAAAVIRTLEGDRTRTTRAAVLSVRGLLAARRGDHEEALRLADDGLRVAAETDFLMLQGNVALDRAEVLRLARRLAGARAAATDALEKHRRKEHAIGIRRARELLARLDGDGPRRGTP